MKIFDCFIFNNEVELLELRLNILNDVVDKFVIVEGSSTFSGKKKKSSFLKYLGIEKFFLGIMLLHFQYLMMMILSYQVI